MTVLQWKAFLLPTVVVDTARQKDYRLAAIRAGFGETCADQAHQGPNDNERR